MKGLKLSDIRGWSMEELEKKMTEARKSLFDARLKHARRQLENPMKLREIRRDLAKMLTLKKENL